MGNQFNIVIQNQSGVGQNYNLFNKKPQLSNNVNAKIWTNVVEKIGAPNNASTTFTMNDQFFAVVGNSTGQLDDKVSVTVQGSFPVTLGDKTKEGTPVPGTTLKLVVDQATSSPTLEEQSAKGSAYGAFQVLTTGYKRQDAVNGKWIIGLGGGPDGTTAKPAATIFPEPNRDFQIQPHNIWYVIPGQFAAGTIFDYTSVGNAVEVDFAKLQKSEVTVIHDDQGNLTIQK